MQQQPITITLGVPKDGNPSPLGLAPFPSDAFAAIAPEFDSGSEKPQFVVGVDSSGIVRRLVSQPTTERHVVAALVGTWVAAGLRVQHVEGFVALAKLIRKAAGAVSIRARGLTRARLRRGNVLLCNGVVASSREPELSVCRSGVRRKGNLIKL